MKHLKQFLLMAMLLFTLAPLQVSAKENIDVKEILWGHIKDSYEWHITKVGDHPVVIHLPVIVNTLRAGTCSAAANSRKRRMPMETVRALIIW